MTDLLFPSHGLIHEPELAFHADRPEDKHVHPLKGLVEFGPYSRSLISNVLDPIRLAVIVPYGTRGVIRGLLHELRTKQTPRERKNYLIDYVGFQRIYGVRIIPGPRKTWLELPSFLDKSLAEAGKPHLVLAEHITKAISSLSASRSSFDVLLIYLPKAWEDHFQGEPDENFDLHDLIKAASATLGIPTQIILQDSALAYQCRASVMWRLSIALYAKAGGVPWKVAGTSLDTTYIGLSYAMRPLETSRSQYVTCCSQVFDADGAGLEFLTYDTSEVYIERDNPFLSRKEMRKVMARSLALYQRRHGGRIPKRIVVHKSTEFKSEEVDGCFDAFQSAEEISLIHIQDNVSWRGIKIEQPAGDKKKGTPGNYPCERGSYVSLGGREVLLWSQGNAPVAANGKNFYKEGKGIPSPLLLKRYGGHGGWEEGCREILGLTKMDWNNDSLYN